MNWSKSKTVEDRLGAAIKFFAESVEMNRAVQIGHPNYDAAQESMRSSSFVLQILESVKGQ